MEEVAAHHLMVVPVGLVGVHSPLPQELVEQEFPGKEILGEIEVGLQHLPELLEVELALPEVMERPIREVLGVLELAHLVVMEVFLLLMEHQDHLQEDGLQEVAADPRQTLVQVELEVAALALLVLLLMDLLELLELVVVVVEPTLVVLVVMVLLVLLL
jgi:hypothetical protein